MPNDFLQRYRATILGVVLGTVILIFAFCDLDLIRLGSWFVDVLQPHRIDDIIAAIALVIIGVSVDHRRERRYRLELQVQADRVAALKATMRTIQDLVNNFLSNMQLVHLKAGDTLSPETLELLERITFVTSSKLKALGGLEYVPHTQPAIGVGVGT